MIPDHQTEEATVSNYSADTRLRQAQRLKEKLESSNAAKIGLFTITILGTSMVMGDGTLTPAISGTRTFGDAGSKNGNRSVADGSVLAVLSAVSGIREKAPNLTQCTHAAAFRYQLTCEPHGKLANFAAAVQVVWISVAILVVLFSVQRFGTDKVGYSFAPIISVWFLLIAGTGLYNLAVHDATILRAFNPAYIVQYFSRNGKEAWVSLGGVILCITGMCIFRLIDLLPVSNV